MKDNEFKILDELADAVNDKVDSLAESGQFDELLKKLQEATGKLPESFSVSFDIQLNVFDENKEKMVPILRTGFATSQEKEPYRHFADTSEQKYMVDGEMCIIPDDYCPNCWSEWDFKFKFPTCPICDYELGNQVKYLLDDDICPMCDEGKVSINNPVCDKCGYEVDKDKVVWG